MIVPYIVSSNASENHISKLQESRKWSSLDFCKSLASKGNLDCIIALNYADKWFEETNGKMNKIKTLEILSQSTSSNTINPLKSNTFKIDELAAKEIYTCISILNNAEMSVSPYNNRITRSIKRIYHNFNGINIKAFEHMAKNNYLTCYSSETDQYEYLKDKYLISLKKTKINAKKISA